MPQSAEQEHGEPSVLPKLQDSTELDPQASLVPQLLLRPRLPTAAHCPHPAINKHPAILMGPGAWCPTLTCRQTIANQPDSCRGGLLGEGPVSSGWVGKCFRESELVFNVFSTHLVILLAFSSPDGHSP